MLITQSFYNFNFNKEPLHCIITISSFFYNLISCDTLIGSYKLFVYMWRGDFFSQLTIYANSLEPDQDLLDVGVSVGPDLNPNRISARNKPENSTCSAGNLKTNATCPPQL